MDRQQINYSVYLVTDSTAGILGDRDLVPVVAAAVKGGTHACLPPSQLLSDSEANQLDLRS
jgi:hypothetical protein